MRGNLDQIKPVFFCLAESIRGFDNAALFAFGINETDGSETDLVVNPRLIAVDLESPFLHNSVYSNVTRFMHEYEPQGAGSSTLDT
ncbi:MAG: hypothetical protein VX475_08215 [Myxococcota bacterium]|nr:hypothetical protein [Myxococcota bacterium]